MRSSREEETKPRRESSDNKQQRVKETQVSNKMDVQEKGKEQCATRRQTANSLNPVTKRSPAAPHCRATLSHTVRQSRIGAKRNAEAKKKNRNGNGDGWGRGVATPPTGRGRRRRRLEPRGQPPAAPATAGPPAGSYRVSQNYPNIMFLSEYCYCGVTFGAAVSKLF